MSWGGSVSAMIASIKRNAHRKHITIFERAKKKQIFNKGTRLSDKKASPELIKKIRLRLQKERKRRMVYISTSLVLILFLTYIGLNAMHLW